MSQIIAICCLNNSFESSIIFRYFTTGLKGNIVLPNDSSSLYHIVGSLLGDLLNHPKETISILITPFHSESLLIYNLFIFIKTNIEFSNKFFPKFETFIRN